MNLFVFLGSVNITLDFMKISMIYYLTKGLNTKYTMYNHEELKHIL